MGDKASEPPTSGEHERALVEEALREAAEHAKVASAHAAHPPSVRARLGGGPFVLPPSDTFPGYELLRELHRGGQGVVYQAIQKTTRRKVAVKVMREGPFASQREHARFEREAQILGQLNHPGIVTIHDSGTTSHGLSYFVMDYISGTPLDVYAASVKGSVEDAMRLMLGVCEAVSAAHLKGIIHRDLKPGNILVDGEGKPHILDFGLAKVAGGDTTGEANIQLMTITGQFLGSMPWASPEQAEGRSEKIDVRTDVYSLGVIAYQVLGGRFPYEVVGSMREVMDQIQNVAPMPLRKIRKVIDEDAERIVLKCLAKERERRYQSAAELVRDIQHYLNREPIEARRDSLSYVLRMHLKKRKLAVAVIAPLILAAAVGGVTSAVMWRRAESEKAEATALNLFLETSIRGAAPSHARGTSRTVLEMLSDIADRLDKGGYELEKRPRVKAAAHMWVGSSLLELGEATKSERHLRAAIEIREHLDGPKDLRAAETRSILARALIEQDRYDDADAQLATALAVQTPRLKADDPALATTLQNLAVLRQHQHRYTEAEPLFNRVVEIHLKNKDQESLAKVYYNLAAFYDDQERYTQAEPYYKNALEIFRAVSTSEKPHPGIAYTLAGYGASLARQGRAADGAVYLEECLAIRKKVLPKDHWHIAWAESLLGECLAHCDTCGRKQEAEAHLVRAWQVLRDDTEAPAEPRGIARQRVVDFFDTRGERGDKEKAAEYRAQEYRAQK